MTKLRVLWAVLCGRPVIYRAVFTESGDVTFRRAGVVEECEFLSPRWTALERWLSGPRECADIPEAEIVYEEPASTGGRSPEQDVTLYYAGNISDTAPEARGRSMLGEPTGQAWQKGEALAQQIEANLAKEKKL